jgi:putative redox protein
MPEARVTWVEGMRFVGQGGSGHGLVVDGSAEGKIGTSPMELVLVGLAGCTAVDVINILQKKRQAVDSFEVRVSADRAADHPRVYTRIEIEYVVRGRDLKPRAIEQAIGLSKDRYCSVSAMLAHTAEISTSFRIEDSGV